MVQPAQRRPTKKIKIDIDEPSTSGPKKKLRRGVLIGAAVGIVLFLVILSQYRSGTADNLDAAKILSNELARLALQQRIATELKTLVMESGQFPGAISDLPVSTDPEAAVFLEHFRIRQIGNDRFIVQWIDPDGTNQVSPSNLTALGREAGPGWHFFGDNVVILGLYSVPLPPPPPEFVPAIPPPGQ